MSLYRNPMFGQGIATIANTLAGMRDPQTEAAVLRDTAIAGRQAAARDLDVGALGGRQEASAALRAGGVDNLAAILAGGAMDPQHLGARAPELMAARAGLPDIAAVLGDAALGNIQTSTGVQSEGNTRFGHQAELANDIARAHIAAGPRYAAVAARGGGGGGAPGKVPTFNFRDVARLDEAFNAAETAAGTSMTMQDRQGLIALGEKLMDEEDLTPQQAIDAILQMIDVDPSTPGMLWGTNPGSITINRPGGEGEGAVSLGFPGDEAADPRYAEAADAIARGADPAAVKARLKEMGLDPGRL